MGCCFSSDEDKNSQIGEINERSRLLGNPVSNNQVRGNSHDEHGNHSPSSLHGDEQSHMTRILHQTSANVIDVSTLNSHNLEQHEYMDRAKQYGQRINSSFLRTFQNNRQQCLLTDVPAVERILAADSISSNDVYLIEKIADKAAAAVREVKVEHKEDLVVQFGIS